MRPRTSQNHARHVCQKRSSIVTGNTQTLELLAELARRAEMVRDDEQTPRERTRPLLGELVELGRRALVGVISHADWEDHELNWAAYCSDLRTNHIRAIASAIIDFEKHAEANDERIELSEATKRVFTWWHLEGGRNILLSELPLEDRQLLERAERS